MRLRYAGDAAVRPRCFVMPTIPLGREREADVRAGFLIRPKIGLAWQKPMFFAGRGDKIQSIRGA